MALEDLIATGLVMLLGIEGELWEYYQGDAEWWELHLWMSRN